MTIDAEPLADGGVLARAESEWRFPTRERFFAQLVDIVNEYAARTDAMAVLHAGGVKTPRGKVWILPGQIDAGKSTLVGGLIQAGCAYLGDESIGIRGSTLDAVPYVKPLSLDASSREALGIDGVEHPHVGPELIGAAVELARGDQGPIDRIIFPVYVPGEPGSAEDLDPMDTLRALLANTLNLGRAGSSGLQTLCDLARSAPAVRIHHRDSPGLARILVHEEPHRS